MLSLWSYTCSNLQFVEIAIIGLNPQVLIMSDKQEQNQHSLYLFTGIVMYPDVVMVSRISPSLVAYEL